MSDTAPEQGRVRQRRRTRAAIVNAAAELLNQGQTPGVNEIADAADVSRRTIYQYFPTLDQLLLDATLGLLTQTDVDAAIETASSQATAAGPLDATARVDAMIQALGNTAAASLPLGRSLIRLTVDTPPPNTPLPDAPAAEASAAGAPSPDVPADGSPADHGPEPKRGYRRVAWIERALEPLRADLDDDLFQQLVSGIAMVVGWEALIVLQDLRGLDPDAQVQVSTWAARALIQSTLDEQHRRST